MVRGAVSKNDDFLRFQILQTPRTKECGGGDHVIQSDVLSVDLTSFELRRGTGNNEMLGSSRTRVSCQKLMVSKDREILGLGRLAPPRPRGY